MAYLGEFENSEDVFREYEVSAEDRKNVRVLVAYYTYEDYEGVSYVLFERDGKLYEVEGGHCSCHGLEGQWDEATETNYETILHRVEKGSFTYNREFDKLLKNVVRAACLDYVVEKEILVH